MLLEDLVPVLAVALDHGPADRVQLARGLEHLVGDPDLAHVVQQAGQVGEVTLVLGQLEASAMSVAHWATAAEWRAV